MPWAEINSKGNPEREELLLPESPAQPPSHTFLSTFLSFLVGANPKIVSCPGHTMDYVTPSSLGALLVHLVKPPQTENDTPENVISPGWGQREQGFVMGIWLCLKLKEKQKSAVKLSTHWEWGRSAFIGGRMPSRLLGRHLAKPLEPTYACLGILQVSPRMFFFFSFCVFLSVSI